MITLKQNIEFLRNFRYFNNFRKRAGVDCLFNQDDVSLHLDYAIERLQSLHDNEWDEDRIDVIGQNGNSGEHYEQI